MRIQIAIVPMDDQSGALGLPHARAGVQGEARPAPRRPSLACRRLAGEPRGHRVLLEAEHGRLRPLGVLYRQEPVREEPCGNLIQLVQTKG